MKVGDIVRYECKGTGIPEMNGQIARIVRIDRCELRDIY